MENFETIDKGTIVNGMGTKYLEFRASLKPHYSTVWLHLFLGYAALVLVMVASAYLQHTKPAYFWITIPVAGLLIGFLVAGILLFMHEASHFNIASDKKRNDLLANIFIGLLVGMDIKFYRTIHASHHRFLGTKHDTEKSYFEPISWRFLVESITGIRILKVMAHRNKNIEANEGPATAPEIIKRNNRMFLVTALLNLTLVVVLYLAGYWQVALAWVVGLGAGFPFFASFRQILEHRRVDADKNTDYNQVDSGASHRMFGDGLIGVTMGPAGFNRHLLHHWDPSVSYTRLKDVEDFLMDTPLKSELQASRTTYFKTFVLLFNT